MKIELHPGYGVFLTKRQLEESVSNAGKSAMKLIRNIISVFYSREEMAKLSACGNRKHPGLDKDILAAAIRKC